jgi:hypothetical protein
MSSSTVPRRTVEATDEPTGRSVAIHNRSVDVMLAPPSTRSPSAVAHDAACAACGFEP